MPSITLEIFNPICDRRIDLRWIRVSHLFYDVLIEEVEKNTKIELDGLNLSPVVDDYYLIGSMIEETDLLTLNA